MRFLLTLGLFWTSAAVLAAPIPKDKDKPVKDEDAIQGTWILEKFDGPNGPPPDIGQIRMIFKDGKLTMSANGQREEQGTYKLNPTAKIKEIDLTSDREMMPGIYELDGDTLRLAVPEEPKQGRPTEMKSGKTVAVVTLKREKDNKKEK